MELNLNLDKHLTENLGDGSGLCDKDGPFMTISLSRGYLALVDPADYEMISKWKWCARSFKSGRVYAVRAEGIKPNRKIISMHRQVSGFPATPHIDHKNRNGIDNRRRNLRPCSPSQNSCNKEIRKGASRYCGVQLSGRVQKWSATVKVNRKTIFFGEWHTEKEAAIARDSGARLLHGEFAFLNFPDIPQAYSSIEEIREAAKHTRRGRYGNPRQGDPVA